MHVHMRVVCCVGVNLHSESNSDVQSPLLAFAAMTARRGQPTDDGSLNGGDHVVIDTQDSFRSFGGKSSELKDAAEDAGEGCDEGGDVATSLPAFRSKASSSGYSITLA